MIVTDRDSAFILYNQVFPIFKEIDDTTHIIKCHIGLSDIYKNKGQYSIAYNHLWDALLMAEEVKDTLSLVDVHKDLGGLYTIYEKYDDALAHLKTSLGFTKSFITAHNTGHANLTKVYYAIAINHLKRKQYQTALDYLDSCSITKQKFNLSPSNTAYVDAQRGYIYLKTNLLTESLKYLDSAHQYFEKNNLPYYVMTSLFLGDLYAKQANWRKASQFYFNSLQTIESTKIHSDVKVEILKKLAHAYKKLGHVNEAFTYLDKSMAITDSLFNAKSAINNALFQIKNKYEETIKEKDKFIRNQNLTIERNDIIQSRFKVSIAFLLVGIFVIAVMVKMRYKLRKASMEKSQIKMQAHYDREKADEIINIKSRELTANTLQMIEKDQTIDELMQKLKEGSPASYKLMKVKVSKGNKDMWEQFNKRFTEVNADFYDKLREKHPDLTPTEQKHCALIKLNFDSKEMASLLHISLNSVHISRHRIRKKMGLERDVNLSNYIADVMTTKHADHFQS
ncbi:hypothetical protein V6R21_01160 [Limibacter armeniacum]|uniref:tetratricopeptide repeat protein n=1 Tax=Limibacter armeniacum TaxID=466084 RepID=UPI002FE583AD